MQGFFRFLPAANEMAAERPTHPACVIEQARPAVFAAGLVYRGAHTWSARSVMTGRW